MELKALSLRDAKCGLLINGELNFKTANRESVTYEIEYETSILYEIEVIKVLSQSRK